MEVTDQIGANQARDHLAEIIGRARFAGKRTIISSRGRAVAAVVSITDLERLEQLERAPKEVAR